jgi:multicomponent Na+:H+ antiporter subunit D
VAFVILLPILTPLLTAALCLLLWSRPRLQRVVSVLGGVGLLASSIMLTAAVIRDGVQVVQLGNWPAPYGITMAADLFSGIMVVVTGVIGLAVLVYSLPGVEEPRQRFGYHPLLHILLLGVCGAFLTGDIFNMYVWFEVMLIASFVLMALGGEKGQLEGAIKYVTLNLISSALFLAAAGVLYSTVGTLNMADLARRLSTADVGAVPSIGGAILLIAFGIKAGAFPLFFWLPASYHTPPAAVSAVMAGLLTKVGVYALVRIFSLLFAYEFAYLQPLLLIVAATTMVTGVLSAAAQGDFRRILSFHIISQIGYMILGLAIFTPLALAGTVFYLVHHIFVKTNLFLIAGVVHRLKGSYRLSALGGLYREHIGLALLFLIPALSLAGLPPLSGFWAKLVLVRAGLEGEHYLLVATALGVSLLTLYSMTKIWSEAFWKAAPQPAAGNGHPIEAASKTPWACLVAPSVALAVLTVGLGLAAEPLLLLAQSAADQLLDPTAYIHAVLGDL